MCNTAFFFAGVNGVDTWGDNEMSLKGLKDKLTSFFTGCADYHYSVNIVWLDYAALMSDLTIKNVLLKSSDHDYYRPSIIIGTQPIDAANKEESAIYEKKIKQFDNNIHTYYCRIDKWEVFQTLLVECLEKIRLNFELGLYKSQVTKEYYEFYLRMIENNSLKGGHSSTVIPFAFTSEKEMYARALKYAWDFKKLSAKWDALSLNLLLVDDYATKSLKPIKEGTPGLKSKIEILEAVWNRFSEDAGIKITINVRAIEEPDIDKLDALPDADTPDIILLDYNFNTPESGVDFIRKLTKKGSRRKGPFDKFWLFPVTSFSNAFIDELQNQSLGFIHQDYELSRGADFINTPNLFLFYMMQMIWDITSRGDSTIVRNEIKRVSENLDSYTSWDAIHKAKNDFEKDYSRFVNSAWHIEYILEAKTGILNDAKKSLENQLTFIKQLNTCKELLFNLTSKNYEGNDDIVILINELKRTVN